MAESVQRRMESMTEELAEMVRINLYSQSECRKIVKRREKFEYKINGVSKDLQDWKDYIQSEKDLLRDIRLRRDKLRISEKKGSLENKIIKRIKQLYDVAVNRFSNDYDICLSYFKFCKQVKYAHASSMAVTNMMTNHPENPEIWKIAAAWHVHDRNDINSALKVLLKGITINKDSQMLYLEAIKLELRSVESEGSAIKAEEDNDQESLRLESNELEDGQKLCVKKLNTYVTSIFKDIQDYEFYIKLLSMFESHAYTKEIQDILVTRLLEHYSDNEIVWHTLAQRERKGFHYQETDSTTTKTRLLSCIAKYKEGLERVPQSNKANLWSMYIGTLAELKLDELTGGNLSTTSKLLAAIEEAYAAGCLAEEYFIKWLELVGAAGALEILEKGTKALPHSLELWKSRLHYHMKADISADVTNIFQAGVEALKEKSLPLWLAYIRYHILSSDRTIIKAIYEEGVKQPEEVSNALKPRYLEWLVMAFSMKDTRAVYKTLAEQKPYCKELHTAMSNMESLQGKPDVIQWESVHKNACEQFGKVDVDVWISYIEFFVYFNKEVDDINGCIQRVYKEAERSLNSSLLIDFLDRYRCVMENA